MPIIIPKELPAYSVLKDEKIFVMDSDRAVRQDIRPIEIAILNLMPTKETTETQLLRLVGNTPLQVNVTFIATKTYTPTHTSKEHMNRFYKSIDDVEKMKFDGMIVTGAPVEDLPFEQVKYWEEFVRVVNFAKSNVTSTVYICWGAQAALHAMYGIDKTALDKKMFGIFPVSALDCNEPLFKGLDDVFYIPNSRHTAVDRKAVEKYVDVLAELDSGEVAIAKSKDGKSLFFMGHSEYDRYTLKEEYERDLQKGLNIEKPQNYFADNLNLKVNMNWKSTATLMFANWLNYYVYQVTPYTHCDAN